MSFGLLSRFHRPLLWLVSAVFVAGCASTSEPGSSGDPMSGTAAVTPSGPESTERRRARVRTELAAQYLALGQAPTALEQVRIALQVDPRFASAHGLLGLILFELGDRPQADAAFRQALNLAPRDPEILNNYGWFLCQTGQVEASLERFRQALANPLYATPALAWANLGICTELLGQPLEAREHFAQAFRIDPSSGIAMQRLAQSYLTTGELDSARFYSRRLFDVFGPTPQTVWLELRVARASNDAMRVAEMARLLRDSFPQSREFGLLTRGVYEP